MAGDKHQLLLPFLLTVHRFDSDSSKGDLMRVSPYGCNLVSMVVLILGCNLREAAFKLVRFPKHP